MYKISGRKLEFYRAKLIEVKGQDVPWGEFADICGVTPQTIGAIRRRGHHGSYHTGKKIVEALRSQGVEVDVDDLLAPALADAVPS